MSRSISGTCRGLRSIRSAFPRSRKASNWRSPRERQAVQQETGALEQQLPRLEAEIASLKRQTDLEQKQRGLNRELINDYEQLAKSGLARKSTYIEVRREEARIDGNIGRLESEALKAELLIGEVQFKIVELRNVYHRRVSTELRDAERSLLELTVSLPAAHRVRAASARQAGLLAADQASQAAITVIRASGTTNVKHEAAMDFLLRPGDIVQVGSLFPTAPDVTPDGSRERRSDPTPFRGGSTAASRISTCRRDQLNGRSSRRSSRPNQPLPAQLLALAFSRHFRRLFVGVSDPLQDILR